MGKNTDSLFDEDFENWRQEWKNMPEFIQHDLAPVMQIKVNFETLEDVQDFARLIGQKLTTKTKSIWHPKMTPERLLGKRCVDTDEP